MTPRAKSFLTIGECMIELAPESGGLYRMSYAGDTFNTAWYARKLLPETWTVSYGTCVGADAVSDGMVSFMQSHGIGTKTIRRVPDRTVGLYMIQLCTGERSFSYWRGQSAARCLADDRAWLDGILDGAGVALFSGITLAILPPDGRERLCAALSHARAAGTHVAFDTNLRPRLWSGQDEMRAGAQLGASVADTVLPSFDEESGLFGDATPEDTIARYRNQGASLVAVKNGIDRLHVWSAETNLRQFVPTPAEKVVDTTAAGDSFNAGLLAALLQGDDLDAAATKAMALSAQVVQAKGALVEIRRA